MPILWSPVGPRPRIKVGDPLKENEIETDIAFIITLQSIHKNQSLTSDIFMDLPDYLEIIEHSYRRSFEEVL